MTDRTDVGGYPRRYYGHPCVVELYMFIYIQFVRTVVSYPFEVHIHQLHHGAPVSGKVSTIMIPTWLRKIPAACMFQ